MKTTIMAQIATLVFALSVTAGPIMPRQESSCAGELEAAATSNKSGTPAQTGNVKPKPTGSQSSKGKATKTKSAKSSVVETGGPGAPATTADSDGPATTADSNIPAETSKGSGGGGGGDNQDTPSATITSGGLKPTNGGSAPGGNAGGGGFPAAKGTSILKAVQTIAAGKSFDGGMVQFDRGVSCTGQVEGAGSDAVFLLEEGATISNVIIGPNQIEGIHCNGGCTVSNVWWSEVCEDAFTIKKQADGQTTTIKGGGAKGAADKVIQHNGAGTVSISGFLAQDFGKLYRACGNCEESHERHVIMDNITASNGKILAGINTNFGDTAKITNSKLTGVKSTCTRFEGVKKGSEPKEIGTGNDGKSCIFGADVVGGV